MSCPSFSSSLFRSCKVANSRFPLLGKLSGELVGPSTHQRRAKFGQLPEYWLHGRRHQQGFPLKKLIEMKKPAPARITFFLLQRENEREVKLDLTFWDLLVCTTVYFLIQNRAWRDFSISKNLVRFSKENSRSTKRNPFLFLVSLSKFEIWWDKFSISSQTTRL